MKTAISLFGYIYQECAQTLKELWIHDYHNDNHGECLIFDDFSCFNLEKLVLVGGRGDRLCEVLDPWRPGTRDLPAPRLRSLTIRGIKEQPQLERLITLCEGRSETDYPLREVSVCGVSGPPEWMTRLCGSSSTPIHIGAWDEWDGQMMKLPMVCREGTGIWWPSWEEAIDDFSQNGS